jgi:hypothetical protein
MPRGSGTNSQGNHYNTPGGSNSNSGGSYQCKNPPFCYAVLCYTLLLFNWCGFNTYSFIGRQNQIDYLLLQLCYVVYGTTLKNCGAFVVSSPLSLENFILFVTDRAPLLFLICLSIYDRSILLQQDSNANGSYYYANDNGSTYYNSGSGSSTYTSPSGTSYTSSSSSGGGGKK